MDNQFQTQYLLNFGDSWAHGADAGFLNRYANQMAEKLNRSVLDYSLPSTSAPRMILELQNFLQTEYNPQVHYIALFFITAQERQLIFKNNGEPRELHVSDGSNDDYYRKYYATRLGNFTLNTSIITLQSMCRKYNIQDHYMLGWQYPILWPEVDTSKFYNSGQTNALDIILGTDTKSKLHEINALHPGFINGHPSIDGHQIIANKWLAEIHNRSNTLKLSQ
jgi:hypothetical protein